MYRTGIRPTINETIHYGGDLPAWWASTCVAAADLVLHVKPWGAILADGVSTPVEHLVGIRRHYLKAHGALQISAKFPVQIDNHSSQTQRYVKVVRCSVPQRPRSCIVAKSGVKVIGSLLKISGPSCIRFSLRLPDSLTK